MLTHEDYLQQTLFQVLDDADERVAGALFDKAQRVQAHDRSANRVAFVAADAESKATLRVLSNLNYNNRV